MTNDTLENEILGMQRRCGLKTRQLNYYLESINPVVGQEEAYKASIEFVQKFVSEENPPGLLLVGAVGSGKTLMACSIINTLIAYYCTHRINFSIEFTTVAHMLEEIREACVSDYSNLWSLKSKRSTYQECDILVLDDLGVEKSSEWTCQQLFEIIDYRYNEHNPIIITTNCIPSELREKIGDRNYDRLRQMCILTPITSKSQRDTATSEISN